MPWPLILGFFGKSLPGSLATSETVMDHYTADQLTRSDYVQTAVDQPILFSTPPVTVIANIEATVDQEGVTRIDALRKAVDRTHPKRHPWRILTSVDTDHRNCAHYYQQGRSRVRVWLAHGSKP